MTKCSIFIGDLAIFCTETDLKDAFVAFGEIVEIKIIRNEETNQNLSYGFIKYSNPLSAKRAMTELNGVLLCGRPMKIRWAAYNKNKTNGKDNKKEDTSSTSSVHFSFISYQTSFLVTECSLQELFSKFGRVTDATIKKLNIEKSACRQSGYGFIHYSITPEGIQSAIQAVNSLNDVVVNDVNYKCSLSHSLNKLLTNQGSNNVPDTDNNNANNNFSQMQFLAPSVLHHAHQKEQQQQQQYNMNNDTAVRVSLNYLNNLNLPYTNMPMHAFQRGSTGSNGYEDRPSFIPSESFNESVLLASPNNLHISSHHHHQTSQMYPSQNDFINYNHPHNTFHNNTNNMNSAITASNNAKMQLYCGSNSTTSSSSCSSPHANVIFASNVDLFHMGVALPILSSTPVSPIDSYVQSPVVTATAHMNNQYIHSAPFIDHSYNEYPQWNLVSSISPSTRTVNMIADNLLSPCNYYQNSMLQRDGIQGIYNPTQIHNNSIPGKSYMHPGYTTYYEPQHPQQQPAYRPIRGFRHNMPLNYHNHKIPTTAAASTISANGQVNSATALHDTSTSTPVVTATTTNVSSNSIVKQQEEHITYSTTTQEVKVNKDLQSNATIILNTIQNNDKIVENRSNTTTSSRNLINKFKSKLNLNSIITKSPMPIVSEEAGK